MAMRAIAVATLLLTGFLIATSPAAAQTITVNWASPQQTIDGFGAAAVDTSCAAGISSTLNQFFFSTTSGIGLSILRLQVVPTSSEGNAYFTTGNGYGCSDGTISTSGATILKGELAEAQAAQSYGVSTFFATQWSASGIYKSNGSYNSGGSLNASSSNYSAIAAELNSFISLMNSYSIPIFALSIQNEPDISQTYPSMTMSAAQFDAIVQDLHSDLVASGYNTLIMMPENSSWNSTYNGFAATTLNDSAAGPYVGVGAQHGYGLANIVPPTTYTYNPSHLWQTEASSQSSSYTGTMADALPWAQTIHNYLTVANVNAFVWWFMSDVVQMGNGTDNSALTDSSGNIPSRAYVTGNWSKFVRPGWHRIGVANSGSLLVTAFENSAGTQHAIVVVNMSGSAVSSQAFSVGNSMGNDVIPWITSSNQNLASQAPISVSSGSFTYTIPGDSVVTFSDATAPPTNLTVVVQ